MRSYDEKDEYDVKEAAAVRAEPWMLDLLKRNPDYNSWGPGEDAMYTRDDAGWGASLVKKTWADFGPWELDDLNECVNFHFTVERDSTKCVACQGSGYNPETRQLAEDFYDFAGTDRRWCDALTQDEVDYLVEKGRLSWKFGDRTDLTAEEVNGSGGIPHDAINRMMLIEVRGKRLGVYGFCENCEGEGSIYTSEVARLGLVLWMLHPRKGASRGVEIENITQAEVPAVLEWLRAAAARNAARFARIMA